MNYFLCNCTCHSSYFTVLLYMRIIYENLVVVVVVVVVVTTKACYSKIGEYDCYRDKKIRLRFTPYTRNDS